MLNCLGCGSNKKPFSSTADVMERFKQIKPSEGNTEYQATITQVKNELQVNLKKGGLDEPKSKAYQNLLNNLIKYRMCKVEKAQHEEQAPILKSIEDECKNAQLGVSCENLLSLIRSHSSFFSPLPISLEFRELLKILDQEIGLNGFIEPKCQEFLQNEDMTFQPFKEEYKNAGYLKEFQSSKHESVLQIEPRAKLQSISLNDTQPKKLESIKNIATVI